jgi:KDO2-lipid IV(A) lauroyltransferase
VVRPPIEVERMGRLREDIARITQTLAHELELLIRAAPEQWHLLQPNWPSDRAETTGGVTACGS